MAVRERYGKWKTKLENQPVLSEWLHREGRVGLELFGYEPQQDWTYTQPSSSNRTSEELFTCHKQVMCQHQNI